MLEKVLSDFRFQDTTATKKVFGLRRRIRAVFGGTGASKTISITVWLIDYAQSTRNKVIDVISESFPHLEGGAIQDFKDIMIDRGYWDTKCWNESKHFYVFPGGTKLRFTSMDKLGKAHGPRRDVLYLNECNNISYEIARQLMLRTRETIWLDWNPSQDFWYYEQLQGKREDIDELHLTYLDNEALDEATKQEILTLKSNKYLWSVYGLGILSEPEGKIYKGWQPLSDIPPEARLLRRWLDYGYSNDPTAVGDIWKWNDSYILDEHVYQKGLQNKQISDILFNLEPVPIAADSAEPKSNDELKLYGHSVIPSKKGPGSVNAGIQLVQAQKIFVTQRSVNILKEYRNYVWMTDKEGKVINVPSPIFNHHMDGLRYGFETLLDFVPEKIIQQQQQMLTTNTFQQEMNSNQ